MFPFQCSVRRMNHSIYLANFNLIFMLFVLLNDLHGVRLEQRKSLISLFGSLQSRKFRVINRNKSALRIFAFY